MLMEQLMRKGAEEEVFDLKISDQWSAEAIEFSSMAKTASALKLREVGYRTVGYLGLANYLAFILKAPAANERVSSVILFTQLSAYRFYEIVTMMDDIP